MDVEHLSTTLLQGWPVCPARAWADHAARQEEGETEGAEPTRFGSIVHRVCERFHEAAMRGDDPPHPVKLFDEEWRRSGASDLEYFMLGRTKIEEFLDRTLYERAGETVGTEVRFLLDVNTGEIWLREEATKARVRQIIKRGHVPVISTMDRVDRVGPGHYEVYDYKTNAVPFTRWEVDNSIQLSVYDIAVRAIYPDAEKVTCIYDMLRWGRQPVEFDDAWRGHVLAYLYDTWHQIRETDAPEPKLNRYCRYCTIRGNCGVYAEAVTQEIPPATLEDTDDPDRLQQLFYDVENLKHRKALIEARIVEIEELFSVRFGESGGAPIPLPDGGELYLSPNPRYEFDVRTVWDLLKRRDALSLFMEAASISKTKMEKVLKGRGVVRDEVMATMQKRFVKSTLRKRRIGSLEEEVVADV